MPKNLPKPKKGAWFIKMRWSYLPCSWQGWLTYIPYVAYLIGVVILFDDQGSTIMKIFRIVPQWIVATVAMHWLAAHKS